MDADYWGGIAILVVLGGVGLLCLLGAVLGPRRTHAGLGSIVSLTILGLGSIAGGIGAFAELTLATRNTQTLEVTAKYVVPGSVGTVAHDFVDTTNGWYETANQPVFDLLQVGGRYSCSVLDEGYTGHPGSLTKTNSYLESCHTR